MNQTLTGKRNRLALICMTVMVTTALAGCGSAGKNNNQATVSNAAYAVSGTTSASDKGATEEFTIAPEDAEYADAIMQYHEVLLERSFDEDEDRERWETDYPLATGYFMYQFHSYGRDPRLFKAPVKYALCDLNGDGVREMLVAMKLNGEYLLMDIIAMVDGELQNILHARLDTNLFVLEDGLIGEYYHSLYQNGWGQDVWVLEADGTKTSVYSDCSTGLASYDHDYDQERIVEFGQISRDTPALPAWLHPANSDLWKNL